MPYRRSTRLLAGAAVLALLGGGSVHAQTSSSDRTSAQPDWVRIDGATLHPDGSVHLEGGARGGLDRVVRNGLQQASASLSRLVRSSPRFARFRVFLA